MCVGCRARFPKKQLARIVKTKEGIVSYDETGKLSGRGAYICPNNIECFEKAIKTKALERHLEISIGDDIYKDIRQKMNYDD